VVAVGRATNRGRLVVARRGHAAYPAGERTPPMGSDALVDLDQSCWLALAKYNLALATLFGVFAVAARVAVPGNELLLAENGALAVLFGAVQTYAWLSA
jgi:hypothetical protein